MQMRMTNNSYRSNQSSGQNKKKTHKKNYGGGEFHALNENDQDMEYDESDAIHSGDESDHFDTRKRRANGRLEQSEDEDAFESHNAQVENGR